MASKTAAPDSPRIADWRRFAPLELTPLLRGALDAFYERGFYGTTVRDIARRVGQTVPSLYYHHENKEGVFVALLEKGTREVDWRARAAIADGGDRPEAQLVNMVEAITLYMTHRVQIALLDVELRYLAPANRKKYAATRKEVENLLVLILEDGVRKKVFTITNPQETARALLGMYQSIARWYHAEGPLTPEDVAERYIDITLMTVGVRKRTAIAASRPAQRPA